MSEDIIRSRAVLKLALEDLEGDGSVIFGGKEASSVPFKLTIGSVKASCCWW